VLQAVKTGQVSVVQVYKFIFVYTEVVCIRRRMYQEKKKLH